MPTFLDSLREKLVSVARRLRALSLRLAGRTTEAAVAGTQAGAKPVSFAPTTASAGSSDFEAAADSGSADAFDARLETGANANTTAVEETMSDGAAPPSYSLVDAGGLDDQPPTSSETSTVESQAAEEAVAAGPATPPAACEDPKPALKGVRDQGATSAEAAPAAEPGSGEPASVGVAVAVTPFPAVEGQPTSNFVVDGRPVHAWTNTGEAPAASQRDQTVENGFAGSSELVARLPEGEASMYPPFASDAAQPLARVDDEPKKQEPSPPAGMPSAETRAPAQPDEDVFEEGSHVRAPDDLLFEAAPGAGSGASGANEPLGNLGIVAAPEPAVAAAERKPAFEGAVETEPDAPVAGQDSQPTRGPGPAPVEALPRSQDEPPSLVAGPSHASLAIPRSEEEVAEEGGSLAGDAPPTGGDSSRALSEPAPSADEPGAVDSDAPALLDSEAAASAVMPSDDRTDERHGPHSSEMREDAGVSAQGGARKQPDAILEVEAEARCRNPVFDISDGIGIVRSVGDDADDGPPMLAEDLLQSTAAQARRLLDRHRALMDPEELGRAAVVAAAPLDDLNYLLWNRALANHCLLGDEVDEVLYLTITPTILAAALSEARPGRLLPEDAEAAFVACVSTVYHGKVLGHRQRLQTLRRCGADGLPDCIAFLAASVLAAYQMRSDEEAAATAYYSRLADLLKTDISGGHPRGFDPDEFEALWHFLNAWLRAEKGKRLALPGPEAGLRRFVALPLNHVPLRRVDIERLPEFFVWAGYEPGARIARAKLDRDLASWSLGRAPFTNAGMAALRDERRPAVLAQVAHELESWDGAHTDSLGRRSGRVEILLDIVQRRPELFYLPRRPPAFPQVFDDGVRTFEASDEGWYDPVPLGSEDGPALADGFEWQVVAGRLRLVLHRPGAGAIALPASHEYTGYLSHRALQLGAPAAALCRETLADPAAEYLSEISQQRCVPINLPGLPGGWRLFTGVTPRRRGAAPPAGLEALAVEATVDLIPTGGLRVGGRWAWVVGAPPRLIVAGIEAGERVTIDGEPVEVAEDGTLAGNEVLGRPGVHIVEAAGLRRRVEITEPQVHGQPWKPPPPRTVLALPRGSWTLIGAVPGEVATPTVRSATGVVASCSFQPVWAIQAGGGPGARVLCLALPPSSPGVTRLTPRRSVGGGLAWASVIYNAAIRRPRMATLDGRPAEPDERTIWAEYARAARDIKRRVREARR